MRVSLIISILFVACLLACQRDPVPDDAPSPIETALETENSTMTVSDVVDAVEASVVHIQTDKIRLDEFNRPVPVVGAGTGVIIDREGFLVTNDHVIRDATRILVKLTDERVFEAQEVGRDTPTDLAVLRIDAVGLVPIDFGSSLDLRIGEQVVAVGHALDLPGGPSVTGGLVSAFRRRITDSNGLTLRHLIQTDAAINPGNSGGPLLNMRGELVGINTSTIPSADGISFALAIDQARPLIDDLITQGSVNRGFLGITTVNVTEPIAMNLGLPVSSGVSIVSVVPDAPAEQAGLMVNDVIVEIEQEIVVTVADLDRILARYPQGATIEIGFFRGGQRQTVSVTLGERPS